MDAKLQRAIDEAKLIGNPRAPFYQINDCVYGLAHAVLDEVERRCMELSDGVDKDTAHVIAEMRRELRDE